MSTKKSDNLPEEARKLVAQLKKIAEEYHEELSNQDKETVAAYMVGALGKSDFNLEAMQDAYPVYIAIENLTSDLEWSNRTYIDEDWQKLLELIDEFDRQVNNP